MDGLGLFPSGVHFTLPDTSPFFPGLVKARYYRRSDIPIKYYFIDYGLSVSFESFEQRHLVLGKCGRYSFVPGMSDTIPYDPFKVDIWQVGHMLEEEWLKVKRLNNFLLNSAQ